MNLNQLSTHLKEECYEPGVYHIGPGWDVCADTFCIEKISRQFEVFYVERGQRGEAIYRSESEAEACDAFLALLERERFSRAHCVGFFETKPEADKFTERLVSAGINVHRDAVPYNSSTDLRYRVFVLGRDKLRVQEIIGHKELPIA